MFKFSLITSRESSKSFLLYIRRHPFLTVPLAY
nr:MAG TPA: hypothetical protein [Caudoviricetes sp.]